MNYYEDEYYSRWNQFILDFAESFELYQVTDYSSAIWQQFFRELEVIGLQGGISLFLNNIKKYNSVPGKDMEFILSISDLVNNRVKLSKKQRLKTALLIIQYWEEVQPPGTRDLLDYSVSDYIRHTGLGTSINIGGSNG